MMHPGARNELADVDWNFVHAGVVGAAGQEGERGDDFGLDELDERSDARAMQVVLTYDS